jgi:hypothetical protein
MTVEIDWHTGPRAELQPLFELAEDSQEQLHDYLELGRVLVARRGGDVLGHLQLVPTERLGEIELKNMAALSTAVPASAGRSSRRLSSGALGRATRA